MRKFWPRLSFIERLLHVQEKAHDYQAHDSVPVSRRLALESYAPQCEINITISPLPTLNSALSITTSPHPLTQTGSPYADQVMFSNIAGGSHSRNCPTGLSHMEPRARVEAERTRKLFLMNALSHAGTAFPALVQSGCINCRRWVSAPASNGHGHLAFRVMQIWHHH